MVIMDNSCLLFIVCYNCQMNLKCRRGMLGMSGGIEELGSVRWELALCLLACWSFCYFSIWKGIKSSGKARGNLFF